MAGNRLDVDAWVPGGRSAHQVIQGYAVGTRQWKKLLQGGAALAGFQA